MPRKIWLWGATLASIRLLAFIALYATQSTDAQWQLSYLPLWIADLPISAVYFLCPIPFAEAFIGPIWWFLVPIIIWRFARRWRTQKK